MNTLSEQNIEFITNLINKSTIRSIEMKEDLIDHFCCAIEDEMKKGLSFEKSYDKAYQNICPNGFDEIQKETVLLLTFKKIKVMKKMLYLSGYLTAIGITTSIFMKLSHIEGANIAILISAILLILFFLPLLFFYLYRREVSNILSVKLRHAFGYIGIALFFVFLTFKMFHWEGANIIFFISILVINFAFFPLIFFKLYRKAVE